MIAKKTKTVMRISGIGPIHDILQVPEMPVGGFVVFMGDSGTGKDTAVRCVRRACGAKVDLSPNYDLGPREKARIEFFGEEHKLAKRWSVSGDKDELVRHIEDRWELERFVHPPRQDQESRDSERIKQLADASNAKVDLEELRRMVPTEPGYDPISLDKVFKCETGVDAVSAFKRTLDAAAKHIEDNLEKAARKLAAECEVRYKDVDLDSPSDKAVLEKCHQDAVLALGRLEQQRDAAAKASEARKTAVAKLEQLRGSQTVTSVQEAAQDFEAKSLAVERSMDAVRAAEQALKDAKHAAALAVVERDAASVTLKAAKDHEAAISQMTGMLEAELPEAPDAIDLEAAQVEVDETRKAVALGEKVREAIRAKEQAECYKEKADQHAAYALKLREAGRSAEDLLAAAIDIPGIKIYGGRLVCTDYPNEPFFEDLSEGQKYRFAFKVQTLKVGNDGDGTNLACLPQVAWDGQPDNKREMLIDEAVKHGLTVVTGEVADGPIRVRTYASAEDYRANHEAHKAEFAVA